MLRPYNFLRLQTSRDGISQPIWILCCPIFIINFHKLDLRELLEIVGEQVRDGVCGASTVTCPFEVEMGNTINNFKLAVACEAIRQVDPAVGIFLS